MSEPLRKTYKIRRNVPGRDSVIVVMPFEVVAREARSRHLTVDEFLQQYQAVAEYNGFEGVRYTFEEVPT